MILVIGFFAVMMLYMAIGEFTMVPQTADTPIYSLKDSTGVHGSFALGSGTVDSYPAYISYKRNDDGSYQIFSVNAEKSRLYLDDPQQPYVKAHFECSSIFTFYCHSVGRNEFHVPNGTIIQEFRSG
jgi:hypothetical protein